MPTSTKPTPTGRRGLIVLATAVVAILAVAAVFFLAGGGSPPGAVEIGGPFALQNGAGKTVTDQDLKGRYLLVYFGYTYCPDVCPTTLGQVAVALDDLGPKADRLQPLFITVDPRRDTPKQVLDYAANFSPRLMGLTGSDEQIATVAREYRVYYAKHQTGPGADDYSMDHSSLLYLMGPDGRFIAPIRADEDGKQMAADIERHLS